MPGVQVRIILIGGQMQVFVDGDDVTYEQAEEATRRVLAALGSDLAARGVTLRQTTGVEQHKDGASHAHVHQSVSHGH